MSDSESEAFDLNGASGGSDSEDFRPTTKKKASAAAPKAKSAIRAPKAAATKAAPKPRVASGTAKKTNPLKAKNVTDMDVDGKDDSDIDAGSRAPKAKGKAKAVQEDDDDAFEDEAPKRKGALSGPKDASDLYQKMTQIEHILKRPDAYIGSVELITAPLWVYDEDTKRVIHREVQYVPGFFKIIDEILVNAADNKVNDENMDALKVNIDTEEGTISVYNNGRGIPIVVHKTEKEWIPQLIFGQLLTSSNYNDDEKKLTGGRNGYGAKLANIYSKEFTVETACKAGEGFDAAKYKQTWANNMGKVSAAKITSNGRGEEYTRVTFKPDFARFGMTGIDSDTYALLQRRVYDLAGTMKTTNAAGKKNGKDVKVWLNDKRVPVKGFKQYVDMYVDSATAAAEEKSGGAAQARPTVLYERISDRWEVAFTLSDSGAMQHVSFANSIATTKGGTHVSLVADQIAKSLMTAVTKKNKAATVKLPQIKAHMWIFVNALIENPTFDSQTKEQLTLPSAKFGSKPTLSEEFIKKVSKSAIIDNILNWAKFKADKQMKTQDGSKRTRLNGMTKLCDANNAGSRYGKDCTLILTEGDSAKALAVAGLSVVGRDNFGVFPLRGKLLNVREASHDQIMKNEEIQNVRKIMGLQHNKEYTSTDSLRYGRIMIMADQDHDGSHIKGLIINFLDHFYPSLLKLPDFLVEFVTPIVRVRHGKKSINFFTIPEFQQWVEEHHQMNGWSSKYYKGLGTSDDKDARDYFSNMPTHMIPFAKLRSDDRVLIDMAFSKKKVEDRKEWLRNFTPGTFLNHNRDEIPYSEFINKELILFSMADNIRSIPSVVDGLKPSQRKVVFGCFKRKMKGELKVSQLIGYIGEHTAHHHGEASLTSTIVNLAQHFIGSNNLNLLVPAGQFGTRAAGGKDHASARYISTFPEKITRMLMPASDDPLLSYLVDDGLSIEPEWYVPVLPLVLVNGADGIGTGWSTSIPNYHPVDIVQNIRRQMEGEPMVPMTPWYRGFKGKIEKVDNKGKYICSGTAKVVDSKTIEITELPIKKWTDDYKKQLEDWIVGSEKDKTDKEKAKVVETFVKDYREYHTTTTVHFVVTMAEKDVARAQEEGLEKFFKLTTTINTSNMIAFDTNGKIHKYESPEQILEEFYPLRLQYYQKRKDHVSNELSNELDKLNNQARFVKMIVDKELVVSNRKKADIVAELRRKDFKSFPKVAQAKEAGETAEVVEEEPEVPTLNNQSNSDFDYLLGMAIWNLTKEKIEKLNQQAKAKQDQLEAYLRLTPQDLWNTDLDGFLEEWEALLREDEQMEATNKPRKKGAVIRTRKSIGKSTRKKDDDDDDDFEADYKPKKGATGKRENGEEARARVAASKAKVAAAAAAFAASSDEEDEPPARNRINLTKKEESDGEIVVDGPSSSVGRPSAAKAPARKKTAAKRKSGEMTAADSDDDLSARPAPKKLKTEEKQTTMDGFLAPKPMAKPRAPAKKAAAPKGKRKAVDSDDEDSFPTSDGPSVAAPPPKPRIARTAAVKKPTAYIDLSDEEDAEPKGDESFE